VPSPRLPSESLLQSWPQAMNIAERIAALEPSGASSLSSASGTDRCRAAAQVRLKKWREVSGFAAEDRFTHRISLFGLQDLAQFESLLSTDPSALARERPGWVSDVLSAYGDRLANEREEARYPGDADPLLEPWQRKLNGLVEPIFAKKIQEHGPDVLREATARGRRSDVELILASRPKSMYRYIVGIFVLYMHIAELRSPQSKDFWKHLESFSSREIFCSLLARYPVLARALCEFADRWVRAEALLATRYLTDLSQIAEFCGVEPERFVLSSVSSCLGDPHRGLQTVHLLTSSAGARVVYKPTDCRIFEQLGKFLDWIRTEDSDLGYKIPAAIARRGYGWVEYIDRLPCTSESDFAAFYVRMGSMIATSWILSSSDMHAENMIACGGQPTLLDVETAIGCGAEDARAGRGQDPLFRNMIKSSVLRCGLLPSPALPNGEDLVDLSGVGTRSGQQISLDGWRDAGTIHMRKGRIEVQNQLVACAPYVSDARQACAEDFTEEIADGFLRTCQIFLAKREHLLSDSSPLLGFRECTQRVVFKDTSFYGQLTNDLNHPDLLIDAMDRERYLDHVFADAVSDQEFRKLGQAERSAIDRYDIPYFAFDCNSRALISDDSVLIDNYFPLSPVDALLKRVSAADPAEIRRQIWYVRMSLETLRLNRLDATANWNITCCSDPSEESPSTTVSARAVRLVANQIVALKFEDGATGISWPTVLSTKGANWRVTSGGNSLYAGTMGIALFLAYAGRSFADPLLTSLAHRSIDPVIREILTADTTYDVKIGAYSGIAGYLYGLTCLSIMWNEDYSGLQQKLLRDIRDSAARDPFLDVIGGSAGAGLVIANCLEYLQNRELALEAARACADRILAIRADAGDGLVAPVSEDKPLLTGFGHGAAGLSLACLRLSSLLADPAIMEFSVAAREFEAKHFSAADGGWADLRPDITPGVSRLSTWCNGAAGIGLSRCLAFSSEGNNQPDAVHMMDDICFALRSSRRSGIGNSHCLCHGDLGTMELYMAAGRLDGMTDESEYGQRIAGMVAREVLASGPVCGVAPGVSVPGLMGGLAGIGWGLLRSLDMNVPNVLALTL
jgi:class II lanthipeptide synthase